MIIASLVAVALVQQPAPAGRVVIEPANAKISIGDTLRLVAKAFDASGQPLRGATIQWFQPGGRFEGRVDSTGLVSGGATGTIVATVVVRPADGGRPLTATAEVVVLPFPIARIAIEPAVSELVVGQSLTLRDQR
jgi:hypothetical protein